MSALMAPVRNPRPKGTIWDEANAELFKHRQNFLRVTASTVSIPSEELLPAAPHGRGERCLHSPRKGQSASLFLRESGPRTVPATSSIGTLGSTRC